MDVVREDTQGVVVREEDGEDRVTLREIIHRGDSDKNLGKAKRGRRQRFMKKKKYKICGRTLAWRVSSLACWPTNPFTMGKP